MEYYSVTKRHEDVRYSTNLENVTLSERQPDTKSRVLRNSSAMTCPEEASARSMKSWLPGAVGFFVE